MTAEERTVVRMALNDTKRAWLEAQGGYRKVEDDIQGHDLVLRRRAGEEAPHGTLTRWRKGCKCAPCKTARRVYARDWARARRPVVDKPAVGFVHTRTAA